MIWLRNVIQVLKANSEQLLSVNCREKPTLGLEFQECIYHDVTRESRGVFTSLPSLFKYFFNL